MSNSEEKYALLDKLNLCHKCEKSKQLPNRKFCATCLEKIAEYNAQHYDKQKAQEYQARRREIYQEKKQKGICVRCTKKATHGLYCYEHFICAKRHNSNTAARRKRERHERGLIPVTRLQQGLCIRCGQPLDVLKFKMCEFCREQNKINSEKADKTKWRSSERARYMKNQLWREKHDETKIQHE